uniref:DNA mismatch repair endonuclease MutL n=1 Tax=Alloprevotella sp. TaxID=1872471 RepID=UPI004027FA90
MSDIIHLLPDSVANQIAAGEVIQRPASMIKELVENALDAGATHIQVVVEDAGKTLVQVIDNGCGMSETDARMAFERHATSKIQQATDLFALRTMGFRGEALASIAAVAQVELRTRQKGQDLGTCINIEGSKVTKQELVSCPVGANFAVRNLFFNIPARRKFLKSNQTELSNIMAEFERIALAHPDVAFTLQSGSSIALDLVGGNFRQRIVGIFGRRIDKQLVPIEVKTTLANISGFVGMPTAARRKNAHQYLFVNGRFMRHPYFAKAILTAYERLIPEGQQVPFFIKFEVDPARIDVNIHPTKTEIKFEDDSAIFQILLAAVRESLGKYGAVPAIDFNTEARPDIPTFNATGGESVNIAPPQIHINTSFNPFDTTPAPPTHNEQGATVDKSSTSFTSSYTPPRPHSTIDWQRIYEKTQKSFQSETNPSSQSINTEQEDEIEIESRYEDNDVPLPSHFTPLPTPEETPTLLYKELPDTGKIAWNEKKDGDFYQYQGRYIITALPMGMALIDQHRAHIRILYERYQQQLLQHKSASQKLLFPETLTLSPSEGVILNQILPQLKDIGFDINNDEKGNFILTGVPIQTEGIAPTALINSILADALTGQANAADTMGHTISLAMARKVALPYGQLLNTQEMSTLLEQLFNSSTPNLTPDGTLIMTILNPEKLL